MDPRFQLGGLAFIKSVRLAPNLCLIIRRDCVAQSHIIGASGTILAQLELSAGQGNIDSSLGYEAKP